MKTNMKTKKIHSTSKTKTPHKTSGNPSSDKDILEQLRSEHKEVKTLFKKIDTDETQREELFAELESKLGPHLDVEQDVLYSQLRQQVKEPLDVLEAYEEHSIIRNLLKELKSLSPENETWCPKIKILSELVKHHVQEEEGNLFRQAKRAFDLAQRERLCQQYLAGKEEWFLSQEGSEVSQEGSEARSAKTSASSAA